jgi:excisionase family DNA binding protein
MDKETLTTEEAAHRLGVTTARVRQMIIAGRLPAQRFGRSHVIVASDLELIKDRSPGRPPGKVSAANKAATQPANAKNGTLSKKKGKVK